MYKLILMNLEVFPVFISSPPNSTLKISKIASKIFWCPLVVENRKLKIYDYMITWTVYTVIHRRKVCQKFRFSNIIVKIRSKIFWPLITCEKWLFWWKFLENRLFNYLPNRLQPQNLFQMILRAFLHLSIRVNLFSLSDVKIRVESFEIGFKVGGDWSDS